MQDKSESKFRLPTPLEATVGIVGAATLSLGVGAWNYVNSRKDFRKEVDQKVQHAYQKQIDSGSTTADRGKAYEDSKVRDVKKRFVQSSQRLWAASGAISGAILAGIGTSVATAALAVGLSNPAILAIGAAASLVGLAVGGVVSSFLGKKNAEKGADDYINKSLINVHNQQGIDKERVKQEQQEAEKDNQKMLKKIELAEKRLIGTHKAPRANDTQAITRTKQVESLAYQGQQAHSRA